MTETADHQTTPVQTTDPRRPSRLNQALAWVGIVAGVVFVVAVVFFSGFIIGKHSGGSHGMFGHHGKGVHMFHRGVPGMGPMGPMGPPPWAGPGGQPPGGPGTPPTTTPTPPRP